MTDPVKPDPTTDPPADPATPPAAPADDTALVAKVRAAVAELFAANTMTPADPATPTPTPTPADPTTVESVVARLLKDQDRDSLLTKLFDELAELRGKVDKPEPRKRWGFWLVGR